MAVPSAVIDRAPASPPENGLVVSARRPNDPEGARWENGLKFDPITCTYVESYDPDHCDATEVDFSEDVPRSDREVIYLPPGIVSGNKCSALGRTAEDIRRRAAEQLDACTSRQLEDEFWRGTQARANGWDDNFYLTDEALVDRLSNTPQAPVDALACMERALMGCKCGGRGMIHATADLVTIWTSNNLIRREGGLLLTVLNTIVVVGEGYDGSGPGPRNADAVPGVDDPYGPVTPDSGSQWAYATGRVDVRLEEPLIVPENLQDALDRTLNDFTVYATRRAAATHDGCCAYAVLVDAEPCLTGGS